MSKTLEHKQAISLGVKLYHEVAARRVKSVLDAMETATYKNAADVAAFEVIIRDLAEAFGAVVSAAAATKSMLAAEIADLRSQLEERGGSIKQMDTISLRQAKSYGLLPAEAVAAEFERRRSTTLRIGNIPPGQDDVIMTWDGESGQFKVVDRSAPARQYVNQHMAVVDVDSNLRNAEYRFDEVSRMMVEATAEVEAARSASQRYDVGNRVNGDSNADG